jgi:alpha,alpha-trehalose phosphorylase
VGSHERLLDLRAGTLSRKAEWTSPAGDTVRVSSVRLVSLVQRSVAAMCYEVEAVNEPVRIVVQSELVANESLPDTVKDPRAAAVVDCPLVGEECVAGEQSVVMVHRTRASGLRVAAAMGHEIQSPDGAIETEASEDVGRVTVATHLEPGQRLRIVKYLTYGWSSQRSRPALHDQVIAAMAAAKLSGWEGLLREQREYLDEFWAGADVEVDGDPEVQQAVRFGLFHVLQAGARGERRPISSKGLTGPGYDGHTFWDTESFVLPVLTFTQPRVVADALRWRHSTLDAAKARAEQLGLAGAAFPWRTISGDECSGYWPAGTAAFHIGADIAHAVVRYLYATEDEEFARDYGLELLVQTARLWRSLGHHDAQGRFRIDGVTGPDEYSALADDNVYTNLMAQQNLQAAADLAERHPEQAEHLGVTDEETASWRDAAADMYIPYDERLQVHPQSEGFTDHAPWDFESTGADQYPLMLHFPYFDIYRKQVVKQADLALAMHLRGEAFTPEQKVRNFAYYEALTVRDSSLSASTQAVIAAETGHLDLAHDYLGEAALMDLGDLEHNTRDGLHIASLAGAWTALVAGLGGMRMPEGRLEFTPRLPGGITRLVFRMRFRSRRLKIHITAHEVVYELLEGKPLEIFHNGKPLMLNGGAVTRSVSAPPRRPAPTQPRGRAPRRRVE